LQTCAKIWIQIFQKKAFGEEVIDSLESYDFELDYDIEWDDEGEENVSAHDGDLARKLMFPYDKNELNLSDKQLMELDSIADGIEIQRLSSMNVLLDSSCLEGVSYKQLSTRFVRRWRERRWRLMASSLISGFDDPDLWLESFAGSHSGDKQSMLIARQAVQFRLEFCLQCFCGAKQTIGFSCGVTCKMHS